MSPKLQESSDDLAKRRYKAETSFFRWWSWYVAIILGFSIWVNNYGWETLADNVLIALIVTMPFKSRAVEKVLGALRSQCQCWKNLTGKC